MSDLVPGIAGRAGRPTRRAFLAALAAPGLAGVAGQPARARPRPAALMKRPATARWPSRKLNAHGASAAPRSAAAGESGSRIGDPFISAYNDQLHVAYVTDKLEVYDVWCTPFPGVPSQWNHQRVDRDGNSVPVQAGPSAGVYNGQQHFCYIRGMISATGFPAPGTVYDSFYDGSGWQSQKIDTPDAIWINTRFLPPSPNYPFLVSIWELETLADQQHFTVLCNDPADKADAFGTAVIDAFYDNSTGWHSQKINNGGNTHAPAAYSKPFGCVFRPTSLAGSHVSGQQHIAYRAGDGSIWDVWFDGITGHRWRPQQLNNNAKTDAPKAIGSPYAWAVPSNFFESYHRQLHFTYLADRGEIWDVWYDGPANTWKRQKLNIDASGKPFHATNAPAAVSNPAAVVVGNQVSGRTALEQHVAYRDATGIIWDLWYDSFRWQCRQINDGTRNSPAAIGEICLSYIEKADTDGTIYGQLHCAWQARGGEIWDAWHDLNPIPGQPGGRG